MLNETEFAKTAYSLGADYLLIFTGATFGYDGDDINKALWMLRIGHETYSSLCEEDYISYSTLDHDLYGPSIASNPSPAESTIIAATPSFRIDEQSALSFRDSILYKATFYGIHSIGDDDIDMECGYDSLRNQPIGACDIELHILQEVYTTQHHIVRIYKINKPFVF